MFKAKLIPQSWLKSKRDQCAEIPPLKEFKKDEDNTNAPKEVTTSKVNS